MKEIHLSMGLVCLVDDEDYDFLSQWKWSAQKAPHTCYAMRHAYSRGQKPQLILMHRLILCAPPGVIADHADGNGLNNTRSNLRLASPLQNMMNRRGKIGGSSRFKGVWLDRHQVGLKRWRAAIRLNGKLSYLGRYASEEEAGAAYAAAAAEHFGEFHCLSKGASSA